MFIELSKLMAEIPEDARVLDLGGHERVFPRANVVVDLFPYDTRKYLDRDIPEHFGKDDWIIADFCSSHFWKTVPDKSFDFIIVSHTLEDIRDPLYVCEQMIRCGKAGYIEAPSKVRECAKTSASDTFSGFPHHRWIIEPNVELTGLIFKAKLAFAHSRDFLGDSHRHVLDYFHQFDGYFWNGSFSYVEHATKGPFYDERELEFHFDQVIKSLGRGPRRHIFNMVPNSSSPDDGKCLWEYEMPSEHFHRTGEIPPMVDRYPPG